MRDPATGRRRARRAAVMLAACAAWSAAPPAAPPALAQGRVPVAAGTRVRVLVADSLRSGPFLPRAQPLVAAVAATGADTLYLTPPGTVGTLAVPWAGVRAVDVSRGVSRGASALEQGALLAVIGGAYFALAHSVDRGDRPFGSRTSAALVGGGIGFATGAVVGLARPYERWRRVRAR